MTLPVRQGCLGQLHPVNEEPESSRDGLGVGHLWSREAGLWLHFAQLDAIYPLVSAGLLPPMCRHTALSSSKPTKSTGPKTVLHLELSFILPPCSPVGKDSLCPFLRLVTDMRVSQAWSWLNFSNRVGTEAETQT